MPRAPNTAQTVTRLVWLIPSLCLENHDPKVSSSISAYLDTKYNFHRHRVSRAALGLDSGSSFALTPPQSGRSSPYPGHHDASSDTAAFTSTRFADDLEGQNDEAIEGLSAKVKMLKEVRTTVVSSNYSHTLSHTHTQLPTSEVILF